MHQTLQVRDDLVEALVQKASSTSRQAVGKHAGDTVNATAHAPKSSLPSTWSAESSIQLVPPKESDTTDRTLFRRARLAAFDPDGYGLHRGLRRPLFYKSGYLTCAKCNDVTFIDAAALRTILELKAHVNFESIPPENLPFCVGCGETSGLKVGAHDFLSLIEGWHADNTVIVLFFSV